MRNFRYWKFCFIKLPCLLLFVIAHSPAVAGDLKMSIPEIDQCRQLILVTAPGWNSVSVTVHYFERASPGGPWKEALPLCDADAGRNGLAWGIGLHGAHPETGPVKHEGDGRAPAGVFRLQTVFGYASPAAAHITKFPYMQLTASSEGVNDIHSRYYNRVVDSSRVRKDWITSEKMLSSHGFYRWGIIVEHNWENMPGCGSCIFLHIWAGPRHGTAGCTAMAPANLEAIIHWLDESKHPLLVQLPAAEYERLRGGWHLP
jgi:D-alanyl-D-alanine dipeptidase